MGNINDWSDARWFRDFARHVRDELLPKLHSTNIVLSILGESRADVKFAVETGFAVLLDKPIVVVVTPGAKPSDKLIRVADHIVEADLTTDAGRDKLTARLAEIASGGW